MKGESSVYRHLSNKEKYIFWGTGNVGTDILGLWNEYGFEPDFFCCNDKKQWGKEKNGIKILSPDQLYRIPSCIIIVTCNSYLEILKQLIENGIKEEKVIRANAMYDAAWISYFESRIFAINDFKCNIKEKDGCLIDLSFGMILGGVERWCLSLSKEFEKKGIEYKFVAPIIDEKTIYNINNVITLKSKQQEASLLKETIYTIINNMYRNIICNFPYAFFYAACIAKKYIKKDLNIIVVFHNDEEALYDTYSQYSDCIDHCLVISSVIKRKLLKKGFPEGKIENLYWKIDTGAVSDVRNYSMKFQELNIGYAGRVQIFQKRMDNLFLIIQKLKKKNIKFIMNIAGDGNYLQDLKNNVIKYGLENNVIFWNFVPHERIFEFWKKNDICISCSDFEGHSISQSEAMAMGAVLVITDTSGARDDVINGENGYIVPLDNVDALVERIEYLYNNRELLPIMGRKSIKIIKDRNKKMGVENLWMKILI